MNEERLFHLALEKPAGERGAFLDETCAGDAALRQRLEALLQAHEDPGSFLGKPAVNRGAAVGSPTDQCGVMDGPVPATSEASVARPITEGPGSRIGPYRLLQPIGEGGMGTVFMAEQTQPVQRKVALKLIKTGMDSRQVLARFGAERQALALMDHPNIAKVLEAGTTDTGRPYFVMELVKGVPITQYCDERRLTPRERLELFIPVCQAVQHAHQKGIIHRDLKPSNVLVALYDGVPVPKVIDFGVAKAIGQRLTEATLFTEFGSVVGTLEYMSPEQAELNQLDIDTRSDIYSLGVLLYELLTGTTPLERKRLERAAFLESLRLIREEEPPKPSTRLSTTEELPSIAANRGLEPRRLSGLVRGELDWIVMKCLEKDRARRYETANGLVADLRRHLNHEPVEASPPSAAYRLRKFAQRNRTLMATAAVLATALVAVTVIAVLYADRQHHFAVEQARATKTITDLLTASNRLLAIRNFDRGQAAFEKEQIGPGLLWMVESWRSAVAAGDPAWQHAARASLSAWRSYHPRLQGVLSHPGPVVAASLSPDGKAVLIGGDDKTARLWDAATGRPIGPPLHHEGNVLAVAFSPDGKVILTGSDDKTARLWDAATGRPIGPPMPHQNVIYGVAFSPDGQRLASAGSDATVKVWDAATGQEALALKGHTSRVLSVAFSPDGKRLASASFDSTVKVWDAVTGRPIGPPLQHRSSVWAVAFSPNGKTLLTGIFSGIAQLWDAATGRPIGPPLQHRGKVRAVAFSPDGKVILTGSDDKTARRWDAATGRPIGFPLAHQGPVTAVAFSLDGKTVLTGSSDSTVRLWDADVYQPLRLVLEHPDEPERGAFSPDGKMILTGCRRGKAARRWDAATGMPLGPPLPHQGPVGLVVFSPDGKRILTVCFDGSARLWDAATSQPIGPPLPHPGRIVPVAFSPDSKTFMTGSQDRTVQWWDAATGTPLGPPLAQPGAVDAADFSPDGKTLLIGYDMGTAQLWDVATRTPFGSPLPHPGAVSEVKFSPDGKALLTGCEDGMARLWDAATQTPLGLPLPHQGWVFGVAFSPDGKTVITGSRDKTARLWDRATGMPLGPPLPHPFNVSTVAFSPDGKTFLTGSNDSNGSKVQVFRNALELPDDLDRVAAWVEVLTGLTLDAQRGSIHFLDNAAWLARRERLGHARSVESLDLLGVKTQAEAK